MKQRGAWDLFTRNLKKVDNNIDVFLNETDPCDYLATAFFFATSPEGKDYWNDLQDEWDKEIRIK